MNLPTLYKKTSTGKIQSWEISASYMGVLGATHIVTTYGQLDGKKQTAVEVITEGKNIGKANETTHREQAEAEAQSQWEQKKKKGYVESIDDAQTDKVDALIEGGISPMLAHKYDEQGHKIKWPAYVQPKLDGHRCIAIVKDGECTLWSRTRKRITSMPHIVAQLREAFPDTDIVLDGELYHHDYRDKFEELTSLIRQVVPKPGHEIVQYWIYDVLTDNPFGDRVAGLKLVDRFVSGRGKDRIVILPTFEVANEDEMISIFGAFINEGYEGLMVRNANGLYKNKRSYDLQKVKVFQDAEYPVVAIEEGKGKMAGRAMFVCDAGNGQTFRVKMVGTLDSLKDYFDNPDPWIGKQLTVKFQKFSAEGIPIFPIAMRFREDV